MNRRRVAIWAFVIAILVAVGAGAWFLLNIFFGANAPAGDSSWKPSIFFPVSGPGVRPSTDDSTGDTGSNRRSIPKLRHLSDVPTAGAVAFEAADGTPRLRAGVTFFRWIERATGHIYETRSDDTTQTRVSNTTVPGLQEAFFSDDGQTVVARYLRDDHDTIETVVGKVEAVTSTSDNGYVFSDTKLVTRYLEPGIAAADDSPFDGFFYTLAPKDGGSAVKLVSYGTSTGSTIFQSPFSQWVVNWASTTLAVRSKADPDYTGYLLGVMPGTNETEKLISGHLGLTTLINPAGTRALFSETTGNDLRLWEKNLETGDERLFELRTLPEKCAWSPTEETVVFCGAPDFYERGSYPTNWYQGRFSFDDNIWSIEVDSERYSLLHDTRTSDQAFDVWKPLVSPNSSQFLFLNKKDLTLWALDTAGDLEPTE